MKNTQNSNITVDYASAALCRYCAHPTPREAYREASPPAGPQAYEIKTCRVALCTGFISRIPFPTNRGTPAQTHVTIDKNLFHMPGIYDEGFDAVIQKKTPKNLEMNKSRPAIIGSGQSSSSLSAISKKLKLKSEIISRISRHISVLDDEFFSMDI